MKRRSLLHALGATPLAMAAVRLAAAPATDARLLVVLLRGGYDCANLLIPITSAFYREARPNIAIAPPAATETPNAAAALPLDERWGLHPALRESLHPLYLVRQAAFIPFAGTDDLSRSHFETQDSIEFGHTGSHRHDFSSGFLNRLLVELDGGSAPARAISFTDQLPIVLRGAAEVGNIAVNRIGRPGIDDRQAGLIEAMYQGTPLAAAVSDGFALRAEVMRSAAAGEMEGAGRSAISAKGFEAEARRVARVMRDDCTVGFIDVGGWDTHVGQGSATGYLAGRFDELGRGLAGFADEMGATWSRTVVVVISEFGRTFRENGNRGTDHGHGSVYWVLGGSIAGGRVIGEQVALERGNLFQDRDYPVLNRYDAIFAGLFERLYGLSPARLERIFPGVQPRDLGLV